MQKMLNGSKQIATETTFLFYLPRHVAEVDAFSVLRPAGGLWRRNGLDEAVDGGRVAVARRLAAAADDDWRAVAQQVHVT